MKKTRSRLPLFTACGLLLAVTAFAQLETTEDLRSASPPTAETVPASPAAPPSQPPVAPSAQQKSPLTSSLLAQEPTLISTTGLVGTAIKNAQGENLGEIRELMIDQSGRIVYALVRCSGIFGMKQKTLAIPWETLRVGLNQTEVVVELRDDQLYPPAHMTVSQR